MQSEIQRSIHLNGVAQLQIRCHQQHCFVLRNLVPTNRVCNCAIRDTSSLGTQLRDSSLADLHLSRVIDGFAASTLMKYLSAIGNFVRRCKQLGVPFLDPSALQLADALIRVQLSRSSDTSGCSSTGTLKALRWWQKVAVIDPGSPYCMHQSIKLF